MQHVNIKNYQEKNLNTNLIRYRKRELYSSKKSANGCGYVSYKRAFRYVYRSYSYASFCSIKFKLVLT